MEKQAGIPLSKEIKAAKMIKILFVCHGNICRSPMAETVMRALIAKSSLSGEITANSAATSREEIGRDIYPPVRRLLSKHGLSCGSRAAVQVRYGDYEKYDYIVCMDGRNLRDLARLFPSDTDRKICRLMDFTATPEDVDDPWYTGDFDTVYRQIQNGCTAMLSELRRRHGI